jgi:hypothetical protein
MTYFNQKNRRVKPRAEKGGVTGSPRDSPEGGVASSSRKSSLRDIFILAKFSHNGGSSFTREDQIDGRPQVIYLSHKK